MACTHAIRTQHSAALPVFNEHVVIKSILNGWAVAQVAPIVKFHGLPQDVRTGVPVHLQDEDGRESCQQLELSQDIRSSRAREWLLRG